MVSLMPYQASDNDAFTSLLDDRGIKSSHDSLYGLSAKKNNTWRVERTTRLVENVLETLLGKCRALDILDRTEFTRETFSLFGGDRPLLLPLELLHHLRVIA